MLRRSYVVQAFKDGKFLAEPEKRGQPKGNPLSDPASMEGMMGMMKGNVAMMVPQTLIMGWVNAFFAGFVLRKSHFRQPMLAVELERSSKADAQTRPGFFNGALQGF